MNEKKTLFDVFGQSIFPLLREKKDDEKGEEVAILAVKGS
jgi:hypothetical protein